MDDFTRLYVKATIADLTGQELANNENYVDRVILESIQNKGFYESGIKESIEYIASEIKNFIEDHGEEEAVKLFSYAIHFIEEPSENLKRLHVYYHCIEK